MVFKKTTEHTKAISGQLQSCAWFAFQQCIPAKQARRALTAFSRVADAAGILTHRPLTCQLFLLAVDH